jgi:hypothetical protein
MSVHALDLSATEPYASIVALTRWQMRRIVVDGATYYRQAEILRRIGAQVVARKATSCVVDFDPKEPRWLYIREPPKTA